jgi:ribonuclease HI
LKGVLELPHHSLAALPRSSIYGLLSYFRPYVADFAVRSEPLRKLLAATHAEWTEEHSKVVKDVIERILEGLPLLNFEPNDPVRLQLKVGPSGFAGILL